MSGRVVGGYEVALGGTVRYSGYRSVGRDSGGYEGTDLTPSEAVEQAGDELWVEGECLHSVDGLTRHRPVVPHEIIYTCRERPTGGATTLLTSILHYITHIHPLAAKSQSKE